MRELSSRLTWLYKYPFPSIWVGAVALWAGLTFFQPVDIGKAGFLLVVASFGSLVLYFTCIRLVRVRLHGDALLISDYKTEISVPLREIERVSGSFLVNPELIFLRFRVRTQLGDKVIFMPPWRFTVGLSCHPLVEELQALAAAKR